MIVVGRESVQLSVVVPTYNESRSIEIMVDRLASVLGHLKWEVIFVDDFSPDGTAEVVRRIARTDRRVRLIARHNRRGLSSAVVEGALAAAADIVAVMDGDLQHDEGVLPRMYDEVAYGKADIACASRFLREDGADGLSSAGRVSLSRAGVRLSNRLFGLEMTDPLTGFFVVKRDLVLRTLPGLSELGFKILLDLITSADPPPRVVEVPFNFRKRSYGESKLDNRVLHDFFMFFIEKKISRFIPLPAEFISFAMINFCGIFVHMLVLYLAIAAFAADFPVAQLVAAIFAMAFNFTINNEITYGDRRLRGADFYLGFAIFAIICSVGVMANVGVATMIYSQYSDLSHILPAVAGALLAVVWNYVATRIFVWHRVSRQNSGETSPVDPLVAPVHREN